MIPVVPATPVSGQGQQVTPGTHPNSPPQMPERWKPGVVTPDINELLKKIPIYSYKTGNSFYISKREHILAHVYIQTQNLHECLRVINTAMPPRRRIAANGKVSKSMGISTIWRWLQKRRISEYIAEELVAQGKVNWFTRDKYLAAGIDMMQNGEKNGVKVAAWKAYGQMRWPNEAGHQVQTSVSINFVQSDGTP